MRLKKAIATTAMAAPTVTRSSLRQRAGMKASGASR